MAAVAGSGYEAGDAGNIAKDGIVIGGDISRRSPTRNQLCLFEGWETVGSIFGDFCRKPPVQRSIEVAGLLGIAKAHYYAGAFPAKVEIVVGIE